MQKAVLQGDVHGLWVWVSRVSSIWPGGAVVLVWSDVNLIEVFLSNCVYIVVDDYVLLWIHSLLFQSPVDGKSVLSLCCVCVCISRYSGYHFMVSYYVGKMPFSPCLEESARGGGFGPRLLVLLVLCFSVSLRPQVTAVLAQQQRPAHPDVLTSPQFCLVSVFSPQVMISRTSLFPASAAASLGC